MLTPNPELNDALAAALDREISSFLARQDNTIEPDNRYAMIVGRLLVAGVNLERCKQIARAYVPEVTPAGEAAVDGVGSLAPGHGGGGGVSSYAVSPTAQEGLRLMHAWRKLDPEMRILVVEVVEALIGDLSNWPDDALQQIADDESDPMSVSALLTLHRRRRDAETDVGKKP